MPGKVVPLSVRVSADDAEFIARLHVEDATTPSEKIRALIHEAQRRRAGYRDYTRALAMARETIDPGVSALRHAEHQEAMHSELVYALEEWLPETFAYFLTRLTNMSDRKDRAAQLVDLEQGIADRILRLLEKILRLGVTPECPAYTRSVVHDRLDPILDLLEVIQTQRGRRPERR
jgi:hypothetical protein